MARPLPRRYCVSFRVDDLERLRLEGFRDTFDDPTWRTAFEWLLAQKPVVDVIVERLDKAPSLPLGPLVSDDDPALLDERVRESAFADIGYNS